MSGKLCYGQQRNNSGAGTLQESKAYCEGIHYRAGGTAVQRPKTDNPHVDGSEAHAAWDLGWDLAQANAGDTVDRAEATCCAPTGTILV